MIMNQIHEFKANLLDKLHQTWDDYYRKLDSEHPQSEFDFLNKMEKLWEIWENYHKLEAQL
jgi:hypothetical protein